MTRRRWETMTPRTWKVLCGSGATAVLLLANCSGSRRGNAPEDAGQSAGSDATVDCIEMQRQYVQAQLGPAPPGDVAGTVHAVLGASDFPQGMPYCSGPRPGSP